MNNEDIIIILDDNAKILDLTKFSFYPVKGDKGKDGITPDLTASIKYYGTPNIEGSWRQGIIDGEFKTQIYKAGDINDWVTEDSKYYTEGDELL